MADELRVLVVDDVRDAAEMMAMVLALEGFHARTAFDGLQALEVAQEFGPHVVLFDIGMPRMDGCDLSRTLREQYGDDVILIAMTGRDVNDHRVASAMHRADHYFLKPVDIDALRRVLSMPMPRTHPRG